MKIESTRCIHIISDLHLMESEPHLLDLFFTYMQTKASNSDYLFVLGDLFEVWVGDDQQTDFNQQVIQAFSEYVQNHGKLFIAHGNRDFLIGEKFAKQCGARLIEESCEIEWGKKKISLIHGDQLCTDDHAYQEFRQLVRSKTWQKEFLAKPLTEREAYAQEVRQQSQESQQTKQMDIMDVNQQAVDEFFQNAQCDWLIHGHTHREASHNVYLQSSPGVVRKRIVLSDWGKKGHYLSLENGEYTSCYFS